MKQYACDIVVVFSSNRGVVNVISALAKNIDWSCKINNKFVNKKWNSVCEKKQTNKSAGP